MPDAPPAVTRPIGVLGAGAMGSLFAGSLAAVGIPVMFLCRESPHVAAIRANGLALIDPEGRSRRIMIPIGTDSSSAAAIGTMIVLVKAWATETAVAPLAAALPADALVVTLQNGLGNREALVRGLPGHDPSRIVTGVTSEAALIPEPGTVRHTGRGSTSIGIPGGGRDTAHALRDALDAAGLPAVLDPDIDRAVWRKLSVNAAINGVTALAGVANGAVAADDQLRGIALRAAGETEAVARALGIDMADVAEAVVTVAVATAANRSSMLRDIEEGRRTEWASIYGEIVRLARERQIDAPVCETLGGLASARERASMDGNTAEGSA